jgi:hypothetical protein
MANFQIYSSNGGLFTTNPIIEAETGRKALDKFLKQNNLPTKVKVSSDTIVDYKVTPIVFKDGKMFYDGSKRALWYKKIN